MKKYLSLLLVISMLCAIPNPVFASTYIDPDTMGEESIIGEKIIVDYQNNTITYVYDHHSKDLIKQFNNTPKFSDVDGSVKYVSGISYLLQSGIIDNEESKMFYPAESMSFEEFASWIGAAYRVEHFAQDEEEIRKAETADKDLEWSVENGIIDNSSRKAEKKKSLTVNDAIAMMYKHAKIENNALITGEYEAINEEYCNLKSKGCDDPSKMFTATYILSDEFMKTKSMDSVLTKEEAAHLLSAYIRYVKKPTLIIGENVYNYVVEEGIENNTKWGSTATENHPSVHRQLTVWGMDVLFRDKESSISNIRGKYSETARGYINTGSCDPDTIENDGETFLGHYCNPQLLNKDRTSYPTAATRFNDHYYNATYYYEYHNYQRAYKELGRAMHYLQDITSPPHAALIINGSTNHHSNYEKYARDQRLSVSREYSAPNSTYTYMRSSTWDTMCTSFATESAGYQNIVFMSDSSQAKKSGTTVCLKKAQRIVAGLAYRFLVDTGRA